MSESPTVILNAQIRLLMQRSGSSIISERIEYFRQRRHPFYLLAAIRLIVSQGRLSELLFSLYCLLTLRPGKVKKALRNNEILDLMANAQRSFSQIYLLRQKSLSEINMRLDIRDKIKECLIHGYAVQGGSTLLGEYADDSAMIILYSSEGVRTFSPYEDDPGVRHIHLLHLHDDAIFVATGDSRKYLDKFHFDSGELRFVRRILKRFGGFTAACSIGKHLYLGTDFSNRPNYIYCLQTGEKFGFPRPAFYQYCVLMLRIEERLILCLNISPPYAPPKKTVSIFDSESKRYVFCEEYVEPGFTKRPPAPIISTDAEPLAQAERQRRPLSSNVN
jgi:hypothetical protein